MTDDIRRGARAAQLLNDPLLQEALGAIREDIYYNIETSNNRNREEREELYRMLQVLKAFERKFKNYIETGKLKASAFEQVTDKILNFR